MGLDLDVCFTCSAPVERLLKHRLVAAFLVGTGDTRAAVCVRVPALSLSLVLRNAFFPPLILSSFRPLPPPPKNMGGVLRGFVKVKGLLPM